MTFFLSYCFLKSKSQILQNWFDQSVQISSLLGRYGNTVRTVSYQVWHIMRCKKIECSNQLILFNKNNLFSIHTMQLCKHPPNKAKTLKIMTFHCWPLCKFNAIIAALESVWSITKNYCYSLELSHKTIKQWASVNLVTYNFKQ